MLPEPFGFPVFPLSLAAAWIVGTALFASVAHGSGFAVGRLLLIQLVIASIAVSGSKLYAIILSAQPATGLALADSDGFRYPGAILATVAALPVVRFLLPAGVSLGRWADLQVPGICAALATMRIGCLLEGCCYGAPTELPWGIRFPPGSSAWLAHVDAGLLERGLAASLSVHPLQLYFFVVNVAVGVWAYFKLTSRSFPGEVILLFLVFHEGAKALLESLRDPWLPALQITEVVVFALALAAFVIMRRAAIEVRPPLSSR